MIDPTCVFLRTTILNLSPFPICSWAGVWTKFQEHLKKLHSRILPIIRFQRVVVIGSIRPLHHRGVAAFSHKAPYNSPCFQEGHIPIVFRIDIFFFFLVNSARSCVSRMILLAVCLKEIRCTIFLHVVRILFTAHVCCPLQAPLWCPYFWHLKPLKGCWLFGFYIISTFVGYLTPNPFLCK